MAQAGFERASTMFSWDRIAEDLLEQYQRLLVQKRSSVEAISPSRKPQPSARGN